MHIYYLYNLLLFGLFPVLGRRIIFLIALTFPFFLLFLPDTGADFIYYQNAYETVYFDTSAPLFFRSGSELTAEAGWFTYTGLLHYLLPNYRWFLVVNFLLCLALIVKSLTVLKIDKDKIGLMVAVMVPISFVTIMFWSPRSALPLALCFLGIAYLEKRREILGIFLFFIALMIHSQYAVIIFIFSLFYFLKRYILVRYKISTILAISGLFLIIAYLNAEYVVSILDFIPTAAILTSKLHYLESSETAFRTSGLLSIFVYPLFMWFCRKNPDFQKIGTVLIMLTVFSMLINIAFINNAHIAGRIARASDYFLFSYVLATTAFLLSPRIGSLVLIPMFIVLPFLFPDLYNFTEIMGSLGLY
ncbi:EpsG family protein [Parasphingorhabdus sp. JC815]|uniref:EpsG family protein n=1 Tax=Parasphingorhabdus sp. JC815 TaxID=3232140 RepID=UPI003459CFDD